MKIPLMFINRETVMVLFGLQSAFRHLRIGFKELFTCIIFAIPCIFLTILDEISRMFRVE